MRNDEYVSTELFHFVGRQYQSAQKPQYQLLLKILKSKALFSSKRGDRPESVDAGLTSGELMKIPAICFCDIPQDALRLHMRKYSRFGLAFSKRFLSDNGAKPVIYLPLKSKTCTGQKDRASDFPQRLTTLVKALTELERVTTATQNNPQLGVRNVKKLVSKAVAQRQFLTDEIINFIKMFDEDLPLEHKKNYYMEREWRLVKKGPQTQLKFKLSNIKHILVPQEFYKSILNEFPQLENKVLLA